MIPTWCRVFDELGTFEVMKIVALLLDHPIENGALTFARCDGVDTH
jgi:hypothetical protein